MDGAVWLVVLNQGKWNRQQLISERRVDEATKVQVSASLPQGFAERSSEGPGECGFNWWISGIKPDGQRKYPGAPPGANCGAGHNHNRCCIIPEWNLVIVRLGLDGNARDQVCSDFLANVGAALKDESVAIKINRMSAPVNSSWRAIFRKSTFDKLREFTVISDRSFP